MEKAEKDDEDEDKKEKEEEKSPAQRLQDDLSAPWDNKGDAHHWNRADWSFLANFPALPNTPAAAGKAKGNSEKQKQAVKVRVCACACDGMGWCVHP